MRIVKFNTYTLYAIDQKFVVFKNDQKLGEYTSFESAANVMGL